MAVSVEAFPAYAESGSFLKSPNWLSHEAAQRSRSVAVYRRARARWQTGRCIAGLGARSEHRPQCPQFSRLPRGGA